MKKFETPELEVNKLDVEDILTTSSDCENYSGDDEL